MKFKELINPINWFTKGVKAVGKTVVDVRKVFKGSEADKDLYSHERFIASQQAYVSEFSQQNNRTWWDSLWDGINRMPRPLIVFAIFWYFWLSFSDTYEFQEVNVALDSVPEQMWWIMSAVISFYFAAREFQKGRDKKMALSDKEFDKVQKRIAILREKAEKELPLHESGYTNPSIESWKKSKAVKSED